MFEINMYRLHYIPWDIAWSKISTPSGFGMQITVHTHVHILTLGTKPYPGRPNITNVIVYKNVLN